MQLLNSIKDSILFNWDRKVLCINGTYYTYCDLAMSISSIRASVKANIQPCQKNIGLVANDDLETYASILALWLEGKAYIPINPGSPLDWNLSIIRQSGIMSILNSSANNQFSEYKVIRSGTTEHLPLNLIPNNV